MGILVSTLLPNLNVSNNMELAQAHPMVKMAPLVGDMHAIFDLWHRNSQ